MIEKIILDYLSSALTVPVYMEVPANAPDSFVIVQKTGGGEENHIQRCTAIVQSYSPTLYGASLLNEAVKNSMRDCITLPEICRCKLNSDYYFPDTKQYRYQAVFDITHY